jgi:hypothetical protein
VKASELDANPAGVPAEGSRARSVDPTHRRAFVDREGWRVEFEKRLRAKNAASDAAFARLTGRSGRP